MTWVDKLTRQYRDVKRDLIDHRKKLDLKVHADQEDFDTVSGMINELQRNIAWMQKGSDPGNYRGTQATDAYRYAELRDMDLLPALDLTTDEPESRITDEQKRKLIQVLLRLSSRERQCYLLHTVQGLSFTKVAEELKISKASVQTNIVRARAKVQQGL